MFIFELVIALLLVGAILSLWATRLGVPCGSGNSEAALISKDFLIGNTNATVNHTDGPFGDDMALTHSAIR